TPGMGLTAGTELKLHYTICSDVYNTHKPIFVPNVRKCTDSCWKEKLDREGFKSYISFLVFDDNDVFFGTLCTIDFKPVEIEESKVLPLFQLFSELTPSI